MFLSHTTSQDRVYASFCISLPSRGFFLVSLAGIHCLQPVYAVVSELLVRPTRLGWCTALGARP